MLSRLASLCAVALMLCALALPVSAQATWLRVRSQHFLLVGDASEKEIKQVATRLEQFGAVFLRLFPAPASATPVPTTIVVFRSDSSYRPFKPLYQGKPQANVAGYFQPGEDVNYITLTTEARGSSNNAYGVILHEYTHLLVNEALRAPPVWLNEGLAEYYSTFALSDGGKQVSLGRPIGSHLLRLREQFMPLADLLRVTEDSPVYNEREQTGVFYAESWAVVHYLLQADEGRRGPQLARFSELLATGHTLAASFQQAFQTDCATMERAVRRYVQRNAYQSVTITLARPLAFAAEMQAAPLSEAEAQTYLGDLLMHSDRATEAEWYVQQALAHAPGLALAHSTLGRMRYRQKRYDEAIKSLQQAVALNPQDYLAHYYLAEALSRQAFGPANLITRYPAETAATMRAELQQAITLNANFSEAYHLLAFVNMVNEAERPDAVALLLRARQLKPARLQYALTLAKVYLRRAQFDAARDVLGQVLRSRDNADGELRAEARNLLQQLDDAVQQLARSNALTTTATAQAQSGREELQPPRAAREHERDSDGPVPPEQRLIRKRTEGEHIRGALTGIECAGGQSVIFHVRTGARLYQFHAEQFNRVQLVTYVADVGSRSISCGPLKKELFVILTFRPAVEPRAKYDGEALAVDLVSKDMEMEP